MENDNKNSNENGGIFSREVAEYLGLGLQLAATVTLLVFIGIWLDGKYDTSPILTIICSFLGVTAGMYNFIRTVLKSGK